MSVLADVRWHLSAAAAAQMEELGVDAREVMGVLEHPQLTFPGGNPGEERINGYGLTIIIKGSEVLAVGLDGATRRDWQDWAVSRAYFRDGVQVPEVELPEPDESQLYASSASPGLRVPRRRRKPQAEPAPVETTHVLDRVHPALRASIRAQVDGDFSRLIVHSSTKVEILPART